MIAGRKVTGFTTRGEEEEGVLDTIKSWNRPTIEASAATSGATCKYMLSLLHFLAQAISNRALQTFRLLAHGMHSPSLMELSSLARTPRVLMSLPKLP